MNLWDHLCTVLRARIVSVEDVSNKVRLPQPPQPALSHPSGDQVEWKLMTSLGEDSGNSGGPDLSLALGFASRAG